MEKKFHRLEKKFHQMELLGILNLSEEMCPWGNDCLRKM